MAAKRAILILILTLLVKSYDCQSFLDTLTYSLDTNLLDLKVDKLNNKWFIYETRIIRVSAEKAYNDTLDNLNLNQVSLDLSTPLKNLFYFKNKNLVEIKNTRWGTISSFKLDPIQIYQPSFVKFTADRMIWILDISENKFHKLNENGVRISQKNNPFKVNEEFYFPTEVVILKNNSIALDPSYGIFVLDDYGNLIQAKQFDSCRRLYEYKGQIYIANGNSLIQFQNKFNGDIDFSKFKKIEFDFRVQSLQTFNENALIFLGNKRIYELKNFEKLFE
jgi:hypothetical protein